MKVGTSVKYVVKLLDFTRKRAHTHIRTASPPSLTSPHYVPYTPPHGRRRYISESHALKPTFMHSSSYHTPPFRRYKSVSESQAIATPPPVTRSLSGSVRQHHMINPVTQRMTGTESHDQLRMRKAFSSEENGFRGTSGDYVDSGEPVVIVTGEEGDTVREEPAEHGRGSFRKQESYEAAMESEIQKVDVVSRSAQSMCEEGEAFSHDTNRFPVSGVVSVCCAACSYYDMVTLTSGTSVPYNTCSTQNKIFFVFLASTCASLDMCNSFSHIT